MRVYLTLVRRELGTYFASLTGYLVIAAVLLLLGVSFVDMLDKVRNEPQSAPITETFFITVYFWMILLLTTPIMTMRSFAQEKFSGTYETLMTVPVSDMQVVLAKFTGAWLFYLLTWVPFLAYLMTAQRFAAGAAAFTPLVLLSTFLGLALIGALYMALGCFASALTQSQIVAAMLSYALGIALFVVSLRSLVAESLPRKWADFFSYIAMKDHIEDFASGVIDTRPVVFYLSLTGMFLFLTLKVVESRRWN